MRKKNMCYEHDIPEEFKGYFAGRDAIIFNEKGIILMHEGIIFTEEGIIFTR